MKNITLPVILLCAVLAGCSTQKKPAPPTQAAPPPQAPPAAQTKPAQPANTEVTIDGVAGFQDTPLQPDGKWHVHDPARPQPPVVTPGNFSQMSSPPSDATILFDGTDLSHWTDRDGNPPPWTVQDGAMVSAKSDIQSKEEFGDMQLHVEFREPTPPTGDGQGRGNSGVFLMGRYEIQVLDCYDNKTYADGATGGIYGQHPPLVNACLPPGEWQTYDIVFNVPHFGPDGQLLTPGYVTVFHNGVVVQNHQAIRGATNWKSLGKYTAHGPTGPIALQYHHNPVAFRNIWVRPIAVNNEP
jgi:hypothetical protein